MRATRKDANQAVIVQGLRAYFFEVVDVSHFLGLGFDLIAKRRGKVFVIEVKDGSKPPSARKLTQAEARARALFGDQWVLIESAGDVDRLAAR